MNMWIAEQVDRSNLIIFLLGQATMFVLWLIRMDASGTKFSKLILRELERRIDAIEQRLYDLEHR